MTLEPRDRRAIGILAAAVALTLIYVFWPAGTPAVVAPVGDPVANAEKRLAKLRESAATVGAKEEVLKKVSLDLSQREKGLIVADTAAQAQAQLIQIVRRLGAAEAPPVEIRATELGAIQPLGDAYAAAIVSVQIECRIDQLINLLAGISSQPELITTSDLRVTSSNVKEKTVGVRLTVAGVVPRRLLPQKSQDKKGGAAF
jgi:hypothetical protein